MENLNLVEILKNCPKGTKLYSTIYGEVEDEDNGLITCGNAILSGSEVKTTHKIENF